MAFEPGLEQRSAEHRQRVDAPDLSIDDLGVVVLPAGLVLLRTAMVIDGEHDRPGRSRRGREPDRRAPAVGADLDERGTGHCRTGGQRRGVQGVTLDRRHEPLRRQGVIAPTRHH